MPFVSRLKMRIALVMGSVALLATVVSGGIFFLHARQTQQFYWQRTMIEACESKANALRLWRKNQRRIVEMFALLDGFREQAARLRSAPEDSQSWRVAHDQVQSQMQMIVANEPYFQEMMLLSPDDARVWVSSMPQTEGSICSGDIFPAQGRYGTRFSEPFCGDAVEQAFWTISTPIYDQEGFLSAVLAVNFDASYLSYALFDPMIEENNGRMVLLKDDRILLSPGQHGEVRTFEMETWAREQLAQHRNGYGRYENEQGQWVLGAYCWLDELQSGLMVEIPCDTIIMQVLNLEKSMLLFSLFLFLLLGITGFFAGRWINAPLKRLLMAVEQVRAGDLEARVAVLSQDELGHLAVQFNQMLDELAQAYQTLREQRASYLLLFEEAPDGIALLSPQHSLEMINSGLLSMFGRSEKDGILGRSVEDFIEFSPEDWQALMERGFLRMRGIIRRIEQPPLPVDIRCKVLPDGRIQMIMTDISDQIKAEQLMRDMQNVLEKRVAQRTAALQRANQELEAFTYSVSHDLRAPLRAINGFLRIFLEDYGQTLDDEARLLLVKVQENARRLSELIQHLLNLSRMERRALRIRPLSADDLRQMVLDVVEEVRFQEEAYRHIQVKIGALHPCQADFTFLRQVFENLIANAFKFSAGIDSPQVEIFSFQDADEVIYAVRDNGIGFHMQHHDKIFMLFQRLHAEDAFEGSGVGLNLVKRIIMRHGGRVWAESAPGQGATFYFTLGAKT